ncbi:guanylate kinase [Pasteuria penetrans]|uniref:guanylate kinase n=1 Tax=Pasteuria penetrans TaxID=86005 RepID=UPI000FBCF1AD|nr:guanylate kinase [Pasteuria penetrans]
MKVIYRREGILFVLSGPSGVGKGTVRAAMRDVLPDLIYSISVTTRKPRANERDGVEYFFTTREAFQVMVREDDLIEWVEYADNLYGTPRGFVEKTLKSGQDVLLEIDVQGADRVRRSFDGGVFIFLVPPDWRTLQERMMKRGTETEMSMMLRLGVSYDECKHLEAYDYVVVNDQVSKACECICAICMAERCRRNRVIMLEE